MCDPFIRLMLADVNKSKPPIIEYDNGQWLIWETYDPTMKFGSRLNLCSAGQIIRETLKQDGTVQYTRVT